MYLALLAVISFILLAVVSIYGLRYVAIVAGIIGVTLFFAAWMGLIL
jgi:succinate-acetate transporter protein